MRCGARQGKVLLVVTMRPMSWNEVQYIGGPVCAGVVQPRNSALYCTGSGTIEK